MTRTMFDGILAGNPPAGAALYAGYDDGTWSDAAALAARFPSAIVVRVTVSASDDEGQVLDVEQGDATPAQAVGWVTRRRAAGADPTVYCNTSTWPAVKAAFAAAAVAQPHYWVAQYDGVAAIPAGAIAKQYESNADYDTSVVADYWPGVDPAPSTQGVTMTPAQENTLLEQVGNVYAAVFLGGPSMGIVPPGAANNSVVCKLDYLIGLAEKGTPVDPAAVAAALAPLLPSAPTAAQDAAAVVAAEGAADTAAIGTDLAPKG